MIIGVPKEIKNNENRVALSPAGAKALSAKGHTVIIQSSAGLGADFKDSDYEQAGARIAATAQECWDAEMVMKVKEPIAQEYGFFKPGLILFTYLHLAADKPLTEALLKSGVTAIAYETIEVNKTLPLLTPMSEVAGRMSVQVGAQFLEKHSGGKGILLSGVPGVKRAKVCIIGAGVAGTSAARIAIGMGADVTILDLNLNRLREIEDIFGNTIHTLASNSYNIAEAIKQSDLAIGAVLIPGAAAPKLVSREMVAAMEPGSVIVDIAIDQGGIFETVDRVTTHDNPVYIEEGVLHYAVANMPGAVPRTSTLALTNATLPYAIILADKGAEKAISGSYALKQGLNTHAGYLCYAAVAEALDLPFTDVSEVFASSAI
ncbi:alanine dehydrogenase [Desertivirga brevis]|uniref:alanine dehydrogenase n=1 Tax=Desertivirga brevis TaxID=2810310 RepID=UPI001A9722A4|nr:alanine dehydrogenase [Pedobacter sp. SYSU D00873]